MGIVDRLMRSSVDRALKMQPRKVQRVADETRYSSPQERPRVDDMRGAGTRIAHARFAVADLGAIAVRRELGGMTVTEPGADLGDIDGRELVTWIPGDPETSAGDAMDARNSQLFAALSSDDDAVGAVLAHPPFLLAAAAGALFPVEASNALGAAAGPIDRAPVRGLGVWVVGDGVIAVGTSAVNAAARLEAGERLAQIALIMRKDGHG